MPEHQVKSGQFPTDHPSSSVQEVGLGGRLRSGLLSVWSVFSACWWLVLVILVAIAHFKRVFAATRCISRVASFR